MSLSRLALSDLRIFAAQGLGPKEIGAWIGKAPTGISQTAKRYGIAWKPWRRNGNPIPCMRSEKDGHSIRSR